MNTVENTRYAKFLIKYKFAWKKNNNIHIDLTKNNIKKSIIESINEISQKNNFIIENIKVGQDYVYLTLNCLPKYSPSYIVNNLKGITGRRICIYENVNKIWDRGYLCLTEGKEDKILLKKYLNSNDYMGEDCYYETR